MADQKDEREILRPSHADAIDLLELVRASEDAARIPMDSPPRGSPISPPPLPLTTPAATEEFADASDDAGQPSMEDSAREEFVDVGEEAEELTPSLPSARVASSAMKMHTPAVAVRAATPAGPAEPTKPGLPPAVSIALVLAMMTGFLYLLLALPPLDGATPGKSGPEPANLKLDGHSK